MEPLDLSAVIDAGYSARPEQRWPTYLGDELDRTKVVTSSEIGNCPRQIKFDKMYPRNGFPDWGYAERGHVIEAWAVEQIRRGMPPRHSLTFLGEDQVSFVHGIQAGTPDGVVHYPNGSLAVVDFKSVDPRTNWSKLPKPKHKLQVIQNCDLVEHSLEVKVDHGIILYIDASNLQKRKQFKVTFDHDTADELLEKAERVLAAESPDDLKAEGMFMTDGCKYCAHTGKCSDLVEKTKTEKANMDAAYDAIERATNGIFK